MPPRNGTVKRARYKQKLKRLDNFSSISPASDLIKISLQVVEFFHADGRIDFNSRPQGYQLA